MLSGFIGCVVLATKSLSVLPYVAAVLSLITLMTFASTWRPLHEVLTIRLQKVIDFLRKHLPRHVVVTDHHDRWMYICSTFAGFVVGTLIILVFIVLGIKSGYDSGVEAADKEKAAMASQPAPASLKNSWVTASLKGDGSKVERISGYRVSTSSTHLALFEPKSGLCIYPISALSKVVITITNRQ